MSNREEPDPGPDRSVRYPLTWPASMAEDVAQAARSRTMPMAVWVREAIREKLARDGLLRDAMARRDIEAGWR